MRLTTGYDEQTLLANAQSQVVQDLLKEEKTLVLWAAEYGAQPTQLIQWRATALAGLPSPVARQDSATAIKVEYAARLAASYEEIGRQPRCTRLWRQARSEA